RRAPSRTISSISDDEPSFAPPWPEPSTGTTVSIGLYLPGRRANAGHCLRTSTTRSPGRYTPPGRSTGFKHCSTGVFTIRTPIVVNTAWDCKLDGVTSETEETPDD